MIHRTTGEEGDHLFNSSWGKTFLNKDYDYAKVGEEFHR